MSNITNIKSEAERVLKDLERGNEYIISRVDNRMRQAVNQYPRDTVIRAVAGVVERMASINPSRVISQGEINEIYNNLVGLGSNTQFREALGDLLNTQIEKTSTTDPEFISKNRDTEDSSIDVLGGVDNELKILFEQSEDKYDRDKIASAKHRVDSELSMLGYKQTRTKFAGGNSQFLVFSSDLDTNRGAVRVYIPCEAKSQNLPSVFVAGDQFMELTPENIQTHIVESANFRTNLPPVHAILHSLNILTAQAKKTMPEREFNKIAGKIPTDKTMPLCAPSLLGTIPEEKPLGTVEMPKINVPEPLKVLANDIEEKMVETALDFPLVSVRAAKNMLAAEINSMGFSGTQIKIAAPTSDGFICEAIINTPNGKTSIEVPIEMKQDRPLMPAVFAQSDQVFDFDEETLKIFISKNANRDTYINRDSQLLDIDISKLRDLLVKSALDKNFTTCDEILAAASERFDAVTYKNLVTDFNSILKNASTTEVKSSCQRQVKSPNSIYKYCGHHNVPLHDVVQDDGGNCCLKKTYFSRQAQETEGAMFSSARVLLSEEK